MRVAQSFRESEVLKVLKTNRIKSVLALLAILAFATASVALGPSSDGTYIIRRAVLNNAGGAISDIPSGGIYAMNNSVGQPSAIGVSTVAGNPEKLYAGYQLPLILTEVDSLVTYRVPATLDMRLWWETIPWATGYRVHANGVDPFGPYLVLGATPHHSYVHFGITGAAAKQFYRVTVLRPWVRP